RIARYHSRRFMAGLDVVGYQTNVKIIEVNTDPTPLTQEGVSDYLIQGKTGEILPKIVQEVRKAQKHRR
ncbi:MAG TPA: hypothetical protein VEG28_05125, partial [Dehalococcoidia bacterium]|nr:hypothetical protein [Dehalococcoidia bacterium]